MPRSVEGLVRSKENDRAAALAPGLALDFDEVTLILINEVVPLVAPERDQDLLAGTGERGQDRSLSSFADLRRRHVRTLASRCDK